MVGDTLVELDHISKSFGRVQALTDVSLTIGPGVTGLLGPNGAGKSTLIKILLGLVRSYEGGGTVLGLDLKKQARTIRSQVGYMPEDDCYIENVSAVEMVCFAARLSGYPALESLRRSHEILDFCGLQQERYRLVDTFSTGMRQKVRFAQSIVHDPQLVIIDEPTSGLDPQERQIMLGRIRHLADQAGKAIVISTHILPDVESVCDQVLILSQGRLSLADTMEVISKPTAPELHLKVLGPAEPFVELLESESLEAALSGRQTIVVQQKDAEDTAKIWDCADRAGVKIRSMIPAKNTLEEVFMQAIREETDADS